MIERARETRNAADVRNAVSAQFSFTLARGCSGRLAMDSKTPATGFEGDSVGVESLTMRAKMPQRTAATVDRGASHGSGKRYTQAMPATAAIAAETAERFISRRLTFDMRGFLGGCSLPEQAHRWKG